MRKQPRRAAFLAVLTFLAVLMAHLVTPLGAAAAAPPTAENFERLRQCESGGDYTRRGRRYHGAYQFSVATWRSLGYEGLPHQAPPEVQDEAAVRLQERSGWRQWPACSRRLGLR